MRAKCPTCSPHNADDGAVALCAVTTTKGLREWLPPRTSEPCRVFIATVNTQRFEGTAYVALHKQAGTISDEASENDPPPPLKGEVHDNFLYYTSNKVFVELASPKQFGEISFEIYHNPQPRGHQLSPRSPHY